MFKKVALIRRILGWLFFSWCLNQRFPWWFCRWELQWLCYWIRFVSVSFSRYCGVVWRTFNLLTLQRAVHWFTFWLRQSCGQECPCINFQGNSWLPQCWLFSCPGSIFHRWMWLFEWVICYVVEVLSPFKDSVRSCIWFFYSDHRLVFPNFSNNQAYLFWIGHRRSFSKKNSKESGFNVHSCDRS